MVPKSTQRRDGLGPDREKMSALEKNARIKPGQPVDDPEKSTLGYGQDGDSLAGPGEEIEFAICAPKWQDSRGQGTPPPAGSRARLRGDTEGDHSGPHGAHRVKTLRPTLPIEDEPIAREEIDAGIQVSST